MKKVRKSQKGFTLLELVLVLAIIVLLGGTITTLCLSISNSLTTTYNIDDSADYAMLFAKGFENSFLSSVQKQKPATTPAKYEWYVSNSESPVPSLRINKPGATSSEAVFDPQYLGGSSSTNYKWEILMFYKWNEANSCVDYVVLLKDNFNSTHYTYWYDGNFWVPHYNERKANGKAGTITIEGDSDVTGQTLDAETLTNYGFNPAEFPDDHKDGTYKYKIVYSW